MTATPATLLAAGMVVLGIILWLTVHQSFVILVGMGAFGPAILRELGVLRDHDEFQRESAARAGYHAYLAAGLATVAFTGILEWQGSPEEESAA